MRTVRRVTALSFTFPAPSKRLSSNDRLHWRRKAEYTATWRHAGFLYAKQTVAALRDYTPEPSNVLVTFEVSDPSRRRDPMNAWPTVKAALDGMVDAGLWPDDDARWVTVVQPEFVKGDARVRVDITPRAVA